MSETTLLLRFHSLGDVILATALLRPLAERGGEGVHVLTEAAFVPVFEGSPWVAHTWVREEQRANEADANWPTDFDRVIDLQGTASARRMAKRFGPTRHIRTRSLARRWLVWGGDRFYRPRIPHAVERYAEVAELSGEVHEESAQPEVFVTEENQRAYEEQFPGLARPRSTPRVALLTGASRRSKEYPADLFRVVGQALEAEGKEIVWVEGPDAPPTETVGTRVRTKLSTLKAVLANVDLAISSDSGPMHLATALGLPTLALFGSSVRSLGFWPLGGASKVLEVDGLRCRPCGVHGRDYCRRGDWACLRGISPSSVVDAAGALLDRGKETK